MLPRWPAALDGLRVGVITDLHAGTPHAGLDAVERAAEALADERPDVVCLLGDFIDRRSVFARPVDAAALMVRLAPLRAAPRGVFAVLGNHDWYAGARRIADALTDGGTTVLEDSAAPAGDGLWVAGVGDYQSRGARVDRALAVVPDDAPVLLLSHNPDAFPFVPERVALTLAGHTHGGQVGIPLLRRPFVPSHYGERYLHGHIVDGDRHLHVSSGIGTAGAPVRFLRPPEVVTLTLRAPS
ncbi:MAG TPA: metallophosphoesterase [Solirubrobacteraceae bacterium]|nr:metallophosphoesterase [Solirubrobacteraceae bacterium]